MVQAAGLAPSVHNTQPWRFVLRPDGLELHADDTRRLQVLDRDGRQLHLSCGAAIFHARLAARALGLDVAVQLLPDASAPDRLADLTVLQGAAPTEDEIRLASAILLRHTHRGAFGIRVVSPALVDRLRLDSEAEGALLYEISTRDDLIELEVMLSRADAEEQQDGAYRDELRKWVHADDSQGDGIPAAALEPAPGSSLRQRDFTLSHEPGIDGSTPLADHPAVLILSTADDDPRSWLQAGQALAALLLRAADHGVQAQPLGQVTDALAHRLGLRAALGLVGLPQLVLRLGYASHTGATPRREVEDLLATVAR